MSGCNVRLPKCYILLGLAGWAVISYMGNNTTPYQVLGGGEVGGKQLLVFFLYMYTLYSLYIRGKSNW